MPRFYFHIRTSAGLIRDDEGVDLPSEESARGDAESGARDLLAAAIRAGDLIDDEAFEVADERGSVILRYRFWDAVKLASRYPQRSPSTTGYS